MKKRITSLFLAVVILLSAAAFGASANTVLVASDDAIKILKAEEGFSSKPYWDYAQWTVGYGTKCPDDKLDDYDQNGISEEEAEALLRTYVARFESELYGFMNRTGVQLDQKQFDALVLFSYNCGSGWSYDAGGGLYNAVVSGASGSELIDAFSRWCNAGGQIKTFLLRRRLCEANIYLNGVYSQSAPANFGYVLYDACGGTSRPNVQGYHTELTAAILPTPTYEGYEFEGWYTEKTGGTRVTVLDASMRNTRLYAHWTDGDGNDTAEEEKGTTVTVTANGVNVRKGPGTDYAVTGSANTGDQMVITETATGSGYTWGKFRSGWICLEYTNYQLVAAPEQEEETTKPTTRMGTVQVSDCLRVRSGPSTGYDVVEYLGNGTRVEVLEEKIVGSMVWGKISAGWISLDYVELDPVEDEQQTPEVPAQTQPEKEPKPASQTWTGTVKVNDFLRVRSGPSTANAVVGYLSADEKVTITEKTTSGSMTWGKIAAGWISLDYVEMDAQSTDAAAVQKVTGTVKVNDFLRVRSGPGTSYAIAAYLAPDAKVEILERKTIGSTVWGKIDQGWISLDYVVLDEESVAAPEKVVKTVTADCLRIRSAAGTSNSIVGYLYKDSKVEILETKTVENVSWGKIQNGWICMDYVQ